MALSKTPLLPWFCVVVALSVVDAQTTCTATVGPRPLELGIGVFVLGIFLAVWLVFWIVGCVVREQVYVDIVCMESYSRGGRASAPNQHAPSHAHADSIKLHVPLPPGCSSA